MNDALRLLSNSLKPFGYHIRRYRAPSILRLHALEGKEQAQNITALRRAQDSGAITADARLDRMIVYLRTCVRQSRNINPATRITGANMLESTRRCLRSLIAACNYALRADPQLTIELRVLDDRSDAEALRVLQRELDALKCPWSIRQTKETGQGNSLHEQFACARQDNAIVYFCEDDYLHEEAAIKTCLDFYRQVARDLQTHCVIYPQEHAVLYDDYYPSYILHGADRHWRTMRNATHTFITHGFIVRDYWRFFENTKFVGVKKKRKLGSEARTTNRLFEFIPGFSPLRPAAVHLQLENTLPPMYDWRPLWDRCA